MLVPAEEELAVAKQSARGGKRPGAGRPKSGRKTGVVKIDLDVLSMAKMVAAKKDVTVSDLVSDILRPAIDRELKKIARELLEDKES